MRRLRILAAVASIALIAACGGNDDQTTAVPEDGSGSTSAGEPTGDGTDTSTTPVAGNTWVVQRVKTADASIKAKQDLGAYLQITKDGDVEGNTSCNGFGGSAEVGDGVVTFEPLLATKKACSGKRGDLDTAILGVLQGKVETEISGDTMTMTNTDGATLTFTIGEPPATEM
ncbi:META domain-containing protein [Haloactinopolyspora alba]|uniref:META domain-containing protein n=1 Tax=Haloactinopolyspora alba TaxID=648780 RepID=A0A2P8EFU9_9ACTN|nr:META domain-containing protein [Haloactinopolyspora alba]PSL08341.1 META domain-containing protein [Haloactinopolyspora alba]